MTKQDIQRVTITCPRCLGTQKTDECSKCGGTGKVIIIQYRDWKNRP